MIRILPTPPPADRTPAEQAEAERFGRFFYNVEKWLIENPEPVVSAVRAESQS